MFSFCSQKVKPHPPTGKLFFADWPPGKIVPTPGCVDVGEKICRSGGRFWRTERAEESWRDDQAMMSGVIWSSMKAMRSRNCSLRFFNRCNRSKSGAGD